MANLLEENCLSKNTNDFCSLAFQASNLPTVLHQGQIFLDNARYNLISVEETNRLLDQAEEEHAKLLDWPPMLQGQIPVRSYQFRQSPPGLEAAYPKRVDIYVDIVQTSLCNVWRLYRIKVLELIAKILHIKSLHSPGNDLHLHLDKANNIEDTIRALVDDICASVPYLMKPDEPEAILEFYPHPAGAIELPVEHGPELISSMCQLMVPIYRASKVEAAPRSQRQWLQHYLTLLSKDPVGDTRKAMALEIDLGCNRLDFNDQ